jgi:hypothetical protein
MALALQARKLGRYAHAMSCFSQDKAYEVLGVSKVATNVFPFPKTA